MNNIDIKQHKNDRKKKQQTFLFKLNSKTGLNTSTEKKVEISD